MADREVFDVFADQFSLALSAWSAGLIFGQTTLRLLPSDPTAPPEVVAVIRMSPQHAKAVAMVLRKSLKQLERENGELTVPEKILKLLELSQEDW